MDLATVIGLILAWGALGGALLMEGGEISVLVNIPAFLLVFGGTLGASMIGFQTSQLSQVPALLLEAFQEPAWNAVDVIELLVRLAEKARREGLLGIDGDVNEIDDLFLQRAMRLAIDGVDPEVIREILTIDIRAVQAQRRQGEQLFTTLGGFAPTLGIIGTVVGLIHMLSSLSDPARMGPLIAGAFIATLYGVSSANLIFLPIGNKLRARTASETLIRMIMVEGVLAIQSGDNPRLLEQKLTAFLTPEARLRQAA